MFVPSGSYLTYTVQVNAWSFDAISIDDAISQVSAYLKNNYNLIVTSYDSTVAGDMGSGALTLSLQSNMDRGNTGSDDGVADIRSNVDDAFSSVVKSFGTSITMGDSACSINSFTPTSGGGGPAYSFSLKNLLPSWLGGMPVTPDQQASYTAAGQKQIASVADNTAAAFGANSDAAAAARSSAASQSTAFASDEASLAASQNADAASSDKWLLYGLVAAVVVVVAVVALPYVAAGRSVATA
jgi:hypothetical protein